MAKLADDLRAETEKWIGRLDDELDALPGVDSKQREFLSNVEAYRDDAQHFLEQDELIEAFEAAIWAWAWLEIGQERGILPS